MMWAEEQGIYCFNLQDTCVWSREGTPAPQQCRFYVPLAAGWDYVSISLHRGCYMSTGNKSPVSLRCELSQLPVSCSSLGDGVPRGPCGVWEADGSSLKETKIPVSRSSMRSGSLLVGCKPTFAPGKEKIWTTHCSLHEDRLFGGCMEYRLGMREPAARRKLLAQWQGSCLLGICDATGKIISPCYTPEALRAPR